MQGVVDEPPGGQRLVLRQLPDGARGGGGGAGERGAHDLLAEPLGAARAHAVADGGELVVGQGPVGQEPALLGFPEQGDPVDGFAPVVQCAETTVELPVGRVGEVARPQPADDLVHGPRPLNQHGQEEPLVLGDLVGPDRRRDDGGGGRRGSWRDGARFGAPTPCEIVEDAGQYIRVVQGSSTSPRRASARAAWWRRIACSMMLRWIAPSSTMRP